MAYPDFFEAVPGLKLRDPLAPLAFDQQNPLAVGVRRGGQPG